MPVKIESIDYKPFGRSVRISNGITDLVVTLDVGPRVIRYGFIGKKNVFLENNEAAVPIPELNGVWKIKGGHRFWHIPEDWPRNYVPDDSPVEYKEIKNGVTVIQEEPWTQVRKDMDVVLSPDSAEVLVHHKLTNKNAWPIECGIWGETACAAGGVGIAPMAKKDTGVVCNRVMSLWPYSDMADPRLYWGKDYIFMKQDANAKIPFKYGINQDEGWAAYINGGTMYVKEYVPVPDGKYPDYGCTFETYTSSVFLEVESLSPLKLLKPGEVMTHDEKWRLFENIETPKNEADAEKIRKIIRG
jgi:hypothetical protein